MRAPYYIEVISRNGEVQHRYPVQSLPCHIGRSYDNDFILDDPHASAHHAIIDMAEDGRLRMRDLGSDNGMIFHGRHQAEIAIDGNTIVRIGQTNLRIRCADFPVAAALADTTSYGWEGWPPALAGVALIASVAGLSTALSDTATFAAIRYFLTIVSVLGVAMVWSGVWALANHLFGRHARFGRHLFILGCGFVAIEFWSLVSGVLAYAFSLEFFTRYGNHVVMAITAAMIFFHLLTINPRKSRRFAVFGVVFAVLGSGLMLMNNLQSKGRLADELYMHQLLPPVLRASRDVSVDQFMSDAKRLKAKVDAERAKAISDAGSDGEDPD